MIIIIFFLFLGEFVNCKHDFVVHRRQALLHEIHRLQVEKTLKPNKSNTDKGRLTISNICLPMKKEYVRALAAGS